MTTIQVVDEPVWLKGPDGDVFELLPDALQVWSELSSPERYLRAQALLDAMPPNVREELGALAAALDGQIQTDPAVDGLDRALCVTAAEHMLRCDVCLTAAGCPTLGRMVAAVTVHEALRCVEIAEPLTREFLGRAPRGWPEGDLREAVGMVVFDRARRHVEELWPFILATALRAVRRTGSARPEVTYEDVYQAPAVDGGSDAGAGHGSPQGNGR